MIHLSLAMGACFAALAGLLGLAAGYVAERSALTGLEEPNTHPRSRSRSLAWMLASGVVFAMIAVRYRLSLETVELLAFASMLVYLSLTDMDRRIIPNGCVLAALVIRCTYLVITAFAGIDPTTSAVDSLAGGLIIGLGILLVATVADRVLGSASIGGGDVKLFAVAGCYFGWEQGLLVVFLSCVIGLVCVLFGLGDSKHRFPFGPSIAAACIIVALGGQSLSVFLC